MSLFNQLKNLFKSCPECDSKNIIKMQTKEILPKIKVIAWACCTCGHEWKE